MLRLFAFMTYLDIINSYNTTRWRYSDRSQGTGENAWVKSAASDWNGRILHAAGDYDAPGIDGGAAFVAGSVTVSSISSTSATAGIDGINAMTFLIKVDPASTQTSFTLARTTDETGGTATLDYDPQTDTFTKSFRPRTVPAGLKDGKWHHITFSKETTSTGMYNVLVDGVNPFGTGGDYYERGWSNDIGNSRATKTFRMPYTSGTFDGILMDEIVVYPYYHTGVIPVQQIQAQVAYLETQNGTPVSFVTTPATTDAELVEPTVEATTSPNVNVSADPATATAMPGEASVSVQGNITYSPEPARAEAEMLYASVNTATRLRMLSPTVSSENELYHSAMGSGSKTFRVDVPQFDDPSKSINRFSFTYSMRRVGGLGAVGIYEGTKNASGQWVTGKYLGAINVEGTHTVDLPVGLEVMFLTLNINGGTIWVDNPSNDNAGYTGSYFLYEVTDRILPEPATAHAEMLNATAKVTKGVSFGATPAVASAEMPGGYFPDFTFVASPAGATGTMGAAWFKSNRRVFVEGAAEALGEAVEPAEVYAGAEVILSAKAATGSALARDPDAVNGQEINNDLHDPYWNRIMRLSTEGSLPPAFNAWYRFNERSGGKVYAANAAGRRAGAFDLTGVFEQGVPGINGRNALSVVNAGIVIADDVVHNQGTFIPFGASLEFSIRIEPGHTGRMDILNGQERDGYTSQVVRRVHASIRDGRLYASSSYGGTSMRRIDDGKWHHIVVTTEPNTSGSTHNQRDIDLQFYIDGKLDRTLASEENGAVGGGSDTRNMSRPTKFFGQDTGYPFRGEIMEVVYRRRYLESHEVMDLYLDLFGYKAVRTTPATGEAWITKDNRVVSNMKRMLVLTFKEPSLKSIGESDWSPWDRSLYAKRYGPRHGGWDEDKPQLSPMLGYGYDEEMDIGRYQLIYQDVSIVDTATNEEARRKYAGGITDEHPLKVNRFRDDVTGEDRFVNLQTDIDLDDYEIITFQAYPNPSYKDQAERLKYEAFFNSVNTALADGHKIWITDAYLAADLGWVSRVDTVPVLNQEINGVVSNRGLRGNDVRGYEVFPFDESVPGVAKSGVTPVTKPADGSMPELPKGQPGGSQRPPSNVWSFDVHQNNGYRVVNEIAGLTDLPSWELVEMGARERMKIFNDGTEHGRWAYRMENRTGEDFTWERQYTDNSLTGGGKPVGEKYNFAKPAKGRGLKAGDEFYDYTWFEEGNAYFTYAGSASYMTANGALRRRVGRTWAVPHGALRIGTPVTTFRSTQWNDYGNEVVNPWRNHIRNAVVRPGDRLPDGRKVKGYAYMEFAEHPIWDELAGIGVLKQLTFGPGMSPTYSSSADPAPVQSTSSSSLAPETEYTFDWDYVRGIGRSSFGAGGQTQEGVKVTVSYTTGAGGQAVPTFTQTVTESLPIAQKVRSFHPTVPVPHITWNARGVSWLTLVDTVDAEFSNTAASVATGQGSMLEASVKVDFSNTVSVEPAQAVGTIVAPEEAQVKEVNVQTFAATASAMMNGLQGGYKAEAATGYADMFQGVQRPLDIEEVLFFTLSMNQEVIYVRMEEN